ncbi:MAG: nucleotidyl transferase AbiEii/AbiGii toxin family protein [Solirubrobacteraceae bacterium]
MTALEEHVDLFKADWIREPDLLAQRIHHAGVSDRYTAELAAWCAEVHEHLRNLADQLGIALLLMGGNGTALRFDAVRQRGSRDNDYLTAATPTDIDSLIVLFGERFAALGELMQPHRYEPKNPVRELPLATYVVPVPLLLDHGYSSNNEVKLEFHFEDKLPAAEIVTGTLGPAATPKITAALPELPYQIGLKLITLAAEPVGIEEPTRAASVPRQMYDVDLLLTSMTERRWTALSDYVRERYEHECALAGITVQDGEPFDGIRARLQRWGDCLDESTGPWLTIRAAQQSGLQRRVHLRPWGWRARAYRLILAIEALRIGADGGVAWQKASDLAELVPTSRAKAFRTPLAELAGAAPRDLPVELRDFSWTALVPGSTADLAKHLAHASQLLKQPSLPGAQATDGK